MSDLPKRQYRGVADRSHADTELALSRVRAGIDAVDASIAYSPAAPGDWASPAPTTVSEALDRLAAANTGA